MTTPSAALTPSAFPSAAASAAPSATTTTTTTPTASISGDGDWPHPPPTSDRGTPAASAAYVEGLTSGSTTFEGDTPADTPTADTPTAPTPATTTDATTDAATTDANGEAQISKNQQKKLRRLAHYAATRDEWRAKKKEKLKTAKARRREKRKAEGALEGAEGGQGDEKRVKVEEERKGKGGKGRVVRDITLVLDCGFDELMTDKEIVSMSSQLTRCYSANRGAPQQFKLQVTSLTGRLKERYEGALAGQHRQWKGVEFSEDAYVVNDKDRTEDGDLVYLTADSEETIHELEEGKRYVIGGIVDRNRHKNLCFNKAKEQGIKTARLPIGDYIKMASRQVLTTNQVVEIMLGWLETRDWETAFLKTIPQRKMPKARGAEEGEEGMKQEEGEEEVKVKEEEEDVKQEDVTEEDVDVKEKDVDVKVEVKQEDVDADMPDATATIASS
ncbi:guanine-1-methyltransferase-domain-containing protein [Geopyxis carbonaria]|nr:guanine-1-methyltransferase-domain-containing protein [Geopyxis carbonaria]